MEEIKFWLFRTNDEYIKQIGNLTKKIAIHEHQMLHFDKMRIEVQEEVIEQLLFDMIALGWLKEAEELKDKINGDSK